MNRLDTEIIGLLIKDGRLAYAEIARQLGVTRAHVRDRVQALLDGGSIEQFTAVIDPEKLGKSVSAFLDIKASPNAIEEVAQALADQPEVISLYIMSDMKSLHVHTLTDSSDSLLDFASRQIYGRAGIVSVECQTLLKRIKNRVGGPRL
ncbi:Lrp/AsnC family transcriptional regulator [Guyparkeria halophila]|uniref:Lrp/AsnC family transcriptional regulator n=1 Tax=Guyparkeria halophila TaxID=47960 RepID=A0ABZ0YUJ3_9GAMM|nr:Lrp/AsnC family transcriptional regulator [Guyparkeria halophila]WQH15840.1 Lrp/AsnC family transcriptional regulator [Guyparkeria halophila]